MKSLINWYYANNNDATAYDSWDRQIVKPVKSKPTTPAYLSTALAWFCWLTCAAHPATHLDQFC